MEVGVIKQLKNCTIQISWCISLEWYEWWFSKYTSKKLF